MKNYLLTLTLAACLVMPLGVAVAAGPVADAENYEPSLFANDRLSLISGEMMESLSFGMGIFFDYSRNPIIITDPNSDAVVRTVVGNHLAADLSLSVGLFEWVDLALAIPAVMFQDGEGWNDADGLPVGTLGDIRFALRARLYRTENKLFSMALIPVITFPTGQFLHELSGSDGITFSPTLAFSISSRWVAGGLDLYYRLTQNDAIVGNTRLADQAGLRLLVTAFAIPEILGINTEFMAATTAGKTFGKGAESPMEATLSGTWWHAPANIALTVGAGAGIVKGFATPQFRAFAGLTWTLRQEKKEKRPADEDTDGPMPQTAPTIILDPSKRPGEVEVKRPQVIELDLAPKDQKEPKKVEEKKPAVKKPESSPQAKTVELQSKPKEAIAAPAPAPTPAPAPVKKIEPKTGTPMPDIIYFLGDSTTFTDESRVKLEKLNLLLSANFTLRIRIEGHADRNEKPELALKRAQAIKLWLIDHDIESKRIQTKGLGADEPVASSDLESDRARNRRVTFFVLDN
ncbi:MAG TPA: OmpA family protein [bacterium]|nr:OmpA family protein [bacterium]